ncbi:glycogen debranching protein GlgX [Nordella sp. HKS 07]|uniref:glycogen debranching protein GlgX n=1 Tax=Nordella sp. HKS 07 TaxID=2712222 RepID=UPI0013E17EF6|nr:glycogen debranching protein GlgX [Nordella sp. HKS 07]QIG52062.1 glycogen debranching protein GlgX [Nordella sp. HKS 07]
MPPRSSPDALGATLAEGGVSIAVFSRHATRIEVCLFDEADRETERVALSKRQGDVFSGFLPGIAEGQRYGLRADGPFAPEQGHRFDVAKLLVDPYARRLDRAFTHRPELTIKGVETAPFVPKSIVERPGSVVRASMPKRPGVIYELAVKAFTMRHPKVPAPLRGTVAALAHPAVLEYLTTLGVDTVELMPLAAWIDERHLPALGLHNGWGYNPVSFMAPDPRLARGGFAEIRDTVRALQGAGLQVILDVVYNHTGESDAQGTTLSLRGLDQASYYRHDGSFRLVNDTGCGNTLAAEADPGLRLILDAMRLWAAETGIDGFRFDLAPILGRGPNGFSPEAPFFKAVDEDPALKELLLIAEPWDVGPGGHQLGRFPSRWLEWNDRYRDDFRRFWRGDRGMVGTLATRLAGSSDSFETPRGVNFIAAHDGFTLRDLVSYSAKHNKANGENNRDGTDNDFSWNNGVEGGTQDRVVLANRARDQRALLASLFLSRGTVMLTAGDEFGRSQSGNNNAYAQDNELTWLDWEGADHDLLDHVRALIAFRQSRGAFISDRFLTGEASDVTGLPDVVWLNASGEAMRQEDWNDPERQLLGAALYDYATGERFCFWLNAGWSPAPIALPAAREGGSWRPALGGMGEEMPARSVAVFVEEVKGKRSAAPTDQTVSALAEEAGIQPVWWTVEGERHEVSLATKRALLTAMGLAAESGGDVAESRRRLRMIAKPSPGEQKCFLSPALAEGRKIFGLAAHLYALRGSEATALGNFATLGEFRDTAARAGAAFAGINPLHHLFPTDRSRASPYQPSDRRFIDPIYISVDAGSSLAPLRLVDYESAWHAIKRALLDAFDGFDTRNSEFRAFCVEGGEVLHLHAVFETIADLFGGVARQTWPRELREARSPQVTAFADAQQKAILFRKWLQWTADTELSAAVRRGSPLYGDLALGTAFDGGEIWADPDAFASDVSLGAPPDPFAALGQVWNLAPFNPHVLMERELEPYRQILRANMRHCGMLRIDHVLGLQRQFWVPRGAEGKDGAYVSFPVDHLMRLVAEVSLTHECMVVGEDLGTVPEGLRERLTRGNFLSYKVLWFERDGVTFRAPKAYPYLSLACLGSHDLPTFAGWASGAHLALDHRLKRNPDEAKQRRDYETERAKLQAAFDAAGLARGDPMIAAHEFLDRTGSAIAFVQVDDLFGETEPLNLPGTDREYPNWRRRSARPIEDALSDARARIILDIMRKERSE